MPNDFTILSSKIDQLDGIRIIINDMTTYKDKIVGHHVIIEPKHWIFQIGRILTRRPFALWVIRGEPIIERKYNMYRVGNDLIVHSADYKRLREVKNNG